LNKWNQQMKKFWTCLPWEKRNFHPNSKEKKTEGELKIKVRSYREKETVSLIQKLIEMMMNLTETVILYLLYLELKFTSYYFVSLHHPSLFFSLLQHKKYTIFLLSKFYNLIYQFSLQKSLSLSHTTKIVSRLQFLSCSFN